MKVAIYGRSHKSSSSTEALQSLCAKLEKAGVEVLVYEPFLKQAGKRIKTKGTFTSHKNLTGKV